MAQTTPSKDYKYDALGRLTATEMDGGAADNDTRSYCYDAAGNRSDFKAASDGSTLTCSQNGSSAPAPSPDPSSSPPPSGSSNTPPSAQNDYITGACQTSKSIDLTVNDSDAEDTASPVLVSVGQAGGSVMVTQLDDARASVSFGGQGGTFSVSYTIEDSGGLSDTGLLTIFADCGNGPIE